MAIKKGQVEVQFNWIFILIAGAIILSFFVVIALRQKTASETQTNIDFFVNFEKALTGISSVQGKTLLFEIPKLDLRYDCTSSCDCAAYSGPSRARAQASFSFNDKIIFSPNSLKGNNLLTWSKDWSFPFRVTNFLFMTSPEVKYMIEEDAEGQNIYDSLPPLFIEKDQREQRSFDKQLFSPEEEITGILGNYKVKFVFTGTDPESFHIPKEIISLPDSDVSAVRIIKEPQKPEIVEFYNKVGDSFAREGKSYLFDEDIFGESSETTTYAAIFADDLNAYSCMMNKAMKNYNFVAKVYERKSVNYCILSSKSPDGISIDEEARSQCGEVIEIPPEGAGLGERCRIHYSSGPIDNLISQSESFNFGEEKDSTIFVNNARDLSLQNKNAMEEGCPQIY